MKKTSKVLLTMLCAILLVVGSVMGTLAYLADKTEVVENTFTIGKVDIDLDEADGNEYGEPIDEDGEPVDDVADAPRVKDNTYKLLPGHTYVKDPTVTVEADSEESYIRMLVTVESLDNLIEAFKNHEGYYDEVNNRFMLHMLVDGWDASVWEFEDYDADTATYEFRYYQTVSTVDATDPTVLPALFEEVVIPGDLTNTEIDLLDGVKIKVIAHAMQKDTFADADAAWAAWDAAGVTTYPTPTEAPTEAPVETPVEP